MIRLERVFQLSDPNGKYQNIRISAEAETKEECIDQVYRTFYTERLFFNLLTGNEAGVNSVKEVIGRIGEIVAELTVESEEVEAEV